MSNENRKHNVGFGQDLKPASFSFGHVEGSKITFALVDKDALREMARSFGHESARAFIMDEFSDIYDNVLRDETTKPKEMFKVKTKGTFKVTN